MPWIDVYRRTGISWVVCVLIALSASPLAAQATSANNLPLAPIRQARDFADCSTDDADTRPCRLRTGPAAADISSRLSQAAASIWLSADTIHMLYRPSARDVRSIEVGGGIQLPMSRLPGGDLWVLSIYMPGASRATMSIEFWITTDTGFVRDTLSLREFRGPSAAPRPIRAHTLRGELRTDSLWSDGLGAFRRITSYRPAAAAAAPRPPVIYLGDGQVVPELAALLDTLITVGQLPAVALVGVWSATDRGRNGTPADDSRSVEYVAGVEFAPGVDSAAIVRRRQAHRDFFVSDVRAWAERTLGVAVDREHRAVWGVSNSALFAMSMGREYPRVYGAVIAHSHGAPTLLERPARGWERAPMHFLTLGALEQVRLHRVLAALSDSLRSSGVPTSYRILPSGHDAMTWRESLPDAIVWWLRR